MFFVNKNVWKLPLIILLSFIVFTFVIYADGNGGEKVLIYVGDGMVPEFTNQFISEGVLDNLSRGLESGVVANHGIMPPLPPNTGASWPTIFTGAFTGVHGITNNSFHNANNSITRSGWSWAGSNRAESIATAAEKAGLSVVTVGGAWPSWPPDKANIDGPVLTWPYQWTLGGVISNYEIEGVSLAPYLYVDYKKTNLDEATDSPLNSFSPPKTSELKPKDYMDNVLCVSR